MENNENLNINTTEEENNTVDISLNKEQIIDLYSNIKSQYITFADMLNDRIEQAVFLITKFHENSLHLITTMENIKNISTSINGIVINLEEIEQNLENLEIEYPSLIEQYSKYLKLLEFNPENLDLEIEAAKVHDVLQPYFKTTSTISDTLDILIETYTVEVQAPIELIMNNIYKANEKLADNKEKQDGK